MESSQWPYTSQKMIELVKYLEDAEEYNPLLHAMGLCELFANGVTMTYTGFWAVQGRLGLTVHDCFIPEYHDRKRAFVVYARSLTELAVCLLLKRYSPSFAGSYLYNMMSKAIGRPEHPFWVDAWKRVSWSMAPSLRFVTAQTIRRADLTAFVDGCRAQLAKALMSNDKMDRLIDGLIGETEPWEITVGTKLADAVVSAIKYADIVLAPVPVDCKRCDLSIADAKAEKERSPLRVIMARRDRILLALYLLMGRAVDPDEPPLAVLAKSDIPCFRRCLDDFPFLDAETSPVASQEHDGGSR